MFKDDTYLETVMARYKLGLDHIYASQQFSRPVSLQPGWLDRTLFNLGKLLIILGSRLQQRHTMTAPKTYHPVYPAG